MKGKTMQLVYTANYVNHETCMKVYHAAREALEDKTYFNFFVDRGLYMSNHILNIYVCDASDVVFQGDECPIRDENVSKIDALEMIIHLLLSNNER